MPDGFTDQEWERIETFAKLPRYRRTPEILLPDEDPTPAEHASTDG